MGIYNFEKRFVPKILAGEKQHTIRGERVHGDGPGKILHLYTGLRRPGARLLMRVFCSKIETIKITEGIDWYWIEIDGVDLSENEKRALAIRDGFDDFPAMMLFWRLPKNRLPFSGHIIHWRFDSREEAEREWQRVKGRKGHRTLARRPNHQKR